MEVDKIFTIEEAAQLLGVSKKTLRRYDEAGKLVARRTAGGHRQYLESDLKKYLADSQGTVYLQKEIKEHWSQATDAETTEEREIARLKNVIDRMSKDRDYFIKEIGQVQNLFHQMRQLLSICRRQMLPMDLAKEIDRILRDSQGYLDG